MSVGPQKRRAGGRGSMKTDSRQNKNIDNRHKSGKGDQFIHGESKNVNGLGGMRIVYSIILEMTRGIETKNITVADAMIAVAKEEDRRPAVLIESPAPSIPAFSVFYMTCH